MKKFHLFIILVVGVAIFVIASTAGDASVYVSFNEANTMQAQGENESVHVVGQLTRNDQGTIVGINQSDKLSFSFQMVDQQNNVRTVVYNEPMPPDFERSEQVVVIGKMKGEVFLAEKILLKCPSKYEEKEIQA
jgi:cytochrome c-type biogenesis protein CcmE